MMWTNNANVVTVFFLPVVFGKAFDCPPGRGFKYYAPDNHCIHYADPTIKMNYSAAVDYCSNVTPIDKDGTKPILLEVK